MHLYVIIGFMRKYAHTCHTVHDFFYQRPLRNMMSDINNYLSQNQAYQKLTLKILLACFSGVTSKHEQILVVKCTRPIKTYLSLMSNQIVNGIESFCEISPASGARPRAT